MTYRNGICLNCAPTAWDYPPRGSIRASCGHKLHDCEQQGELISWWDWNEWGDLVEFSGCFCTWCAIHMKVSGRHISTWVCQEYREEAA